MKPNLNKGKDLKTVPSKIKGKDTNEPGEEEEEEQCPPPEKPLNLERFIYITTYLDSNFMKILKKLFEEINQAAFNLKSVKEIYTRELTQEEKENNEIDYISGIQLIDKNIRITIIEGITGMAIKKVKEALPKTQMNSKKLSIFSDSNILFNKRIYSKFDLSLKYIKLRDSINEILHSFDIYTKANKYRKIYDCFLNFGSILKAETLREITDANLYPEAESLLLLERKYGDILKEEDLSGILKEKIIKKKIKIDASKTSTSGFSHSTMKKTRKSESLNVSICGQSLEDKLMASKNLEDFGKNPKLQIEEDKLNKSGEIKIVSHLNSKNYSFDAFIKNRNLTKQKPKDIWNKNIQYLHSMKKKPKIERFCKPSLDETSNTLIMYGPSRLNHYENIVEKMRKKYLKDKHNFYSYSLYGLSSNFPLVERDRNEEYLKYLENKSKWLSPNRDFERYIQPPREKYYFPKINNIL